MTSVQPQSTFGHLHCGRKPPHRACSRLFLDSHVVQEVRLIYHPGHVLAGLPEEKNLWKQARGSHRRESGIRCGSVEAGAPACQEDGLLSHVSGSERQQLALLDPRVSSTAS